MIDMKPACRRMTDVLAGVDDKQLTGPSPCAEYTVSDVIDHVAGASRAFTAMALKDAGERPGPGPADEPTVANLGDGWRDGVADCVRALGEAWDDPAAWQGTSHGAGVDLPNELWGRIAFTEMVVHGWDIAKATGQPFDLPDETLRACLDHVAEFVPKAPVATLWGPPVEVPADAPLLDRVLGITGRRP